MVGFFLLFDVCCLLDYFRLWLISSGFIDGFLLWNLW